MKTLNMQMKGKRRMGSEREKMVRQHQGGLDILQYTGRYGPKSKCVCYMMTKGAPVVH